VIDCCENCRLAGTFPVFTDFVRETDNTS